VSAVVATPAAAAARDGAIVACRSCGAADLTPVLSLGQHAARQLAAHPRAARADEARFPLDLVFCGSCSLVQITETVPPEVLFGEYLYFSSFSDTMLRHAEALVARLVAERRLGPDSLAAEVASNDGYLLQYYVRAGVPCSAWSRRATSRPSPRGAGCARCASSSAPSWPSA
jgi:hypothetical protein